ncbi:hypothetical protein FIBSPDRAFT_874371, partial [Athelia psychrophila]
IYSATRKPRPRPPLLLLLQSKLHEPESLQFSTGAHSFPLLEPFGGEAAR